MIVYAFTVARNKNTVTWLVSKSAGRQLRGSPKETEKQIKVQWETQIGPIDKLIRQEETLSTAEAEQVIASMRRQYLERKANDLANQARTDL